MKWLLIPLFLCINTYAQTKYGYLEPEDQKYYKNDIMEGNNQRERIDSLVKEVNKIYAELSSVKSEMQVLKKELEDLKKSK
jgi:peptidoglycan hydrolase CwlO-like protein